MKKLGKVLLALVLAAAIAAALAGCGGKNTDEGGKTAKAGGSITVFNWDDYIDPAVLDIFKEQTGISVKYVIFTTVEEMYAKVTAGGGAYDVIFPSDYIIERMIKEERLLKLDKSLIPNYANISEWLQTPDYDPNAEYSIPYMWGTVGLLYNTDLVDEEITSWGSIFDPKYQNNVFMLASYRDCLGATLCYLGYDLNTRDASQLAEAKDLLIQQKKNGIVKGYLVDETKDKMIGGEAAIAMMWSGDALYAISESEGDNLVYVVPEEGSNVWVDGACIPAGSSNPMGAHAFIDFLCREEIARMNMDYIYYSTPNQAVIDHMSEEELADETLVPPQEVIDRCTFFHDVSEYIDLYESVWVEILG